MPSSLQHIGAILEGRYRRHAREWLSQAAAGLPFKVHSFPIAMSKREAAADVAAYGAWEAAWRSIGDAGLRVQWEPVAWRDLGRNERPARLQVLSLRAAFSLMPQGQSLGKAFLAALQRTTFLCQAGQEDIATACLAEPRFLLEATNAEFERLVAVVTWLKTHERANCYIREIPVEGVDTKWLENNRALVARLMTNILRLEKPLVASEVATRWNLLSPPALIRVRHAHRLVSGLPADALAALPLSVLSNGCVKRVAVVENLQTGLSLQVPEDVLIVSGMGAAVKALASVAWARRAQVAYMGDLDQHGLAILAELRRALPQTESVLMNLATLHRWQALAVQDPTEALRKPLAGLEPAELALFDLLQAQRLRLEQERLPIADINQAFLAALQAKTPPVG